MARLLEGKTVLVTGAAQPRSIGEAIARRCAEHGARVAVGSRSLASAQKAAEALQKDGLSATGHACDVTSEQSVAELSRALGRIDGIVHNAGSPVTVWDRPFLDVPVDDFQLALDVDLLGGVRLARAFLPAMKEKGGSLVFTSSTAAIAGYEFLHEFAPAKAGALGLMRGLAAEFGRFGIRSNAVAYGNIASPATWDALDENTRKALAAESPMRRWAQPREAAGVSVFLLSDLASFVNGQTLIVDGGTVMR